MLYEHNSLLLVCSAYTCHKTKSEYIVFSLILCQPDIGALQKEVAALEELSRQLFIEYVDMHAVRVSGCVCGVCHCI